MAVSLLDAKCALIIIDLQQGIVSLPVKHDVNTIIQHCARLADAFRQKHLPVVLVNVAGSAPGRNELPVTTEKLPPHWSELVTEMTPQPEDITVTKRTWGAFNQTLLDGQLKALGITQVVIAGIATSIGVESTARQAWELGYNVALATDAMTDISMQAHENSIRHIFPRLGETGTTDSILQLVKRHH